MDKSWDYFVSAANNIRNALDYKPSECKIGYQCNPGGILNAYREGDLNFKEACRALDKWHRNSPKDNIESANSAEAAKPNSQRDEICAYHGKDCGYMRFNGACMGPKCSLHPARKHSPV